MGWVVLWIGFPLCSECSLLHLGDHLLLLPEPAPLEGLGDGVDLREVEMQCTLTGINFCKHMVMGEGMDKVKQHSRITW